VEIRTCLTFGRVWKPAEENGVQLDSLCQRDSKERTGSVGSGEQRAASQPNYKRDQKGMFEENRKDWENLKTNVLGGWELCVFISPCSPGPTSRSPFKHLLWGAGITSILLLHILSQPCI